MCQLLGVSSNKPVNIAVSLKEFQRRGGRNDHGWGFAFHENSEWTIMKQAESLEEADISEKRFQFSSRTIIGHVRLASCGELNHENTHPFAREQWAFAHNGTVTPIKRDSDFQLRHLVPDGRTDSEYAFLYLIEAVSEAKGDFWETLRVQADRIKEQGTFNFLLSDGKHLIAYGDNRLYFTQRKAPFQTVTLRDARYRVDLQEIKDYDETAVIIATEPLTTGENWTQIKGMRVFQDGAEVEQPAAHDP